MSNGTDVTFAPTDARAASPPADPFSSIRYHFGMLLGVDDFETDQGYHRGKVRLHNGWLHRDGVVWGLGVSVDFPHGEVRVARGVALDAAGRELPLDADACLDVGAWFRDKTVDDPRALDAFTEDRELAGATSEHVQLDGHVVARFKACLTRAVPAMAEPCRGGASDTAYSRVLELMELTLVPGLAPARPVDVPYRRLRVLFGVNTPASPTAAEAEALTERARLLALPAATRGAAFLAVFRRLAPLDAQDLSPNGAFTPEGDGAELVLANVRNLTLARSTRPGTTEVSWRLIDPTTLAPANAPTSVDRSVCPAHVATATTQELLCGASGAAPALAADAGGPRVDPDLIVVTASEITWTADADLLDATVTTDSLSVSILRAAGWTAAAVTPSVAADHRTVTVTLSDTLLTAGERVRLIARGTGPTPILGASFVPFAGALGAPPGTVHDGNDLAVIRTFEGS